jgi:hypothetical protein
MADNGGEWPARARRAVQCIVAAAGDDDQSARVMSGPLWLPRD